MDGTRGIYRRALWLTCVLCVVFGLSTVQAATRKHVSMPSGQSVVNNPGAPVTRTGNNLTVPGQPLEGEVILGVDGKKIPVRGILPKIDYSIPRTLNHVKNGMRGGVIGVGVAVGLQFLLDQIDAVVGPNGEYLKEKPVPTTSNTLFWCGGTSTTQCISPRFATPNDYFNTVWVDTPTLQFVNRRITVVGDLAQAVTDAIRVSDGLYYNNHSTASSRKFGQCTAPTYYDQDLQSCAVSELTALSDADYDLMFDIANQQNADWIKNLLKDSCNGSPSPGACFNSLKEQSALTGPATVPGSTTTKTTNSIGSNGVATQTVTTTTNNYKITYGPTYYDYRRTTQIVTKTDGVPVSDTTDEESEDVEQEEQPEEKQDEEPIPCNGQGCDGPAYEDQYTPLDETKEDYLDDYASRVAAIPIIQAVSGLFDVNVSGSCPVWTFNHQMQVLGASMPINLTFDYLCLPWFIQYGPWIRAVIYLVAVYAAIRIALL
ncbi:hypothetical protein L1F06_007640 [Ectopseudomonas hydrolytica]|uniref:TspB protein n=1 Tax=Ectopseudomonas hydrolytica TaxID=2493633 RepID=A0ABY5AD44_9GAMM|nr:hypothetical protein [Pseudomonas hydrolytica]USR41296.1 hypothetical protein L1F06_007640 [Pseudomonas hydrolytica]